MAAFLCEVRNLRVFGVSNWCPTLRTDFAALVRFWLGQCTSLDSSSQAASFLSIHHRLLTKPRRRNVPSKSRKPTGDPFPKTWFFAEIRGFLPRHFETHHQNPIWAQTRHLGGENCRSTFPTSFGRIDRFYVKVE